MRRWWTRGGCLFLCFFAAGCAVRRLPPPSIAILPFDNETNDLDGPDHMRRLLYDRMKEKKFNLTPLADVDGYLAKKGIVDGGQLPAVSMADLKAGVPADVYCYGLLTDYGWRTLVVWSQVKVGLSLRLTDGVPNVPPLDIDGVASRNFLGAAAALNTVAHPVGRIAGALAGSDGKYEAQAIEAIDALIRKMPKRLRTWRRAPKERKADAPISVSAASSGAR